MGKVKLAKHNATGEKCAVKIVPRAAKLYQRAHADDPPIKSAEEAAQRQKEFDKEVARDKRTIREGALGRLLYHPHICRLYEMVPMTNHYYMLFEYVEGGQLLDYIVSHGSLNENYARKFSRGIASALDYCHKNNVVHRDLKIENIMINLKGEIKIIDFGLSNLYAPNNLLKTYCGSLYFAAPELLSAKPYLGPEVDVWSFGVVLYVLVCGKVPFDDPVVSALHEKIKRGNVEYPLFISRECVSLLSRMLVVDPTKRASLAEVIQHPWMIRGYESPVAGYVPRRAPLTLPLDPQIIQAISALDLGSSTTISEELTKIVTSPDYQLRSDNWFKNQKSGLPSHSSGSDLIYGYHPLISIYYLVSEMKRRKKAKEEALKNQMAQQNAESLKAPHHKAESHSPLAVPANTAPRRGSLQHTPSPIPLINPFDSEVTKPAEPIPAALSPKKVALPILPPAHNPVLPNNNNTPVMRTPDRMEAHYQQQQSPRGTLFSDSLDPNAGKSLGFASLFRKLSLAKQRNPALSPGASPTIVKSPDYPDSRSGDSHKHSHNNISPALSQADPLVRRGVSMKITAKEKSSGSRLALEQNEMAQRQQDRLQQPRNLKSHTRSHSTANRPHGFIPAEYLPPLPNLNAQKVKQQTAAPKPEEQYLQVNTKFHPTARAKSVGSHARKDSHYYRSGREHLALPNAMATQNSDDRVDEIRRGDEASLFDDLVIDDLTPKEIPQLSETQIVEQFNQSKRNSMPSIEYPKTLFLKGFFSVQTTSTKPLPVIRYNILKVLTKMGVRFQEVKGGFVCVHNFQAPAEYSDSEDDGEVTAHSIIDDYRLEETSEERKLYGDAFDSSSSELVKPKQEQVTTPTTDEQMPVPLIMTPQQSTKHSSRRGSVNTNGSQQATTPPAKGHRSSNSVSSSHRRKFSIGQAFSQNYKKNGSQTALPARTPAAARINKSLLVSADVDYDDLDEETLAQMRRLSYGDSMDLVGGEAVGGSDMLVSSRIEHRAKQQWSTNSDEDGAKAPTKKTPIKFEINIVKVPLVGLYGVQFKKMLGNTWSYKALASQILNQLNL